MPTNKREVGLYKDTIASSTGNRGGIRAFFNEMILLHYVEKQNKVHLQRDGGSLATYGYKLRIPVEIDKPSMQFYYSKIFLILLCNSLGVHFKFFLPGHHFAPGFIMDQHQLLFTICHVLAEIPRMSLKPNIQGTAELSAVETAG